MAEQLVFYKRSLPELVNWMTDDINVLEAVAGEMFALKSELDATLKDLTETKSNLVESNRISNRECMFS